MKPQIPQNPQNTQYPQKPQNPQNLQNPQNEQNSYRFNQNKPSGAYVCTERIFGSRLLMYNKIFWEKLFQKFVVYIFTLLLAPFASKLVNYWRHKFSVKGAKRSVKMWTTNFYKSFSQNILMYMSSRLSKIRSLHTYVIHRTIYFD